VSISASSQLLPTTIGSRDSLEKSADAKRSVPLGAAAAGLLAGAAVGAAAGLGASVGFAAGAGVGTAAGAIVGAAGFGASVGFAGAGVGVGAAAGAHAANSDAPITPSAARSALRRLHSVEEVVFVASAFTTALPLFYRDKFWQ
jgi:hypothetical protein